MAAMRPARPGRLRWLAAPPLLRAEFFEIRRRLEALVLRPSTEEVYAAHRRSVYSAEDVALGQIAIKELRNETPGRRLWFGWLAEHPGIREFQMGAEFAARGGRTPGFLGAATERGALGLDRVLIFMRWLDGARTLTSFLGEEATRPGEDLLEEIAAQLVAAARTGLVHGRHSSENLLVVTHHGLPELHTIDFSHARLGPALDPGGFIADVARIAHWLVHEKVWPHETLDAFFGAVCDQLHREPGAERVDVRHLGAELERVTRVLAARRRPAARAAQATIQGAR